MASHFDDIGFDIHSKEDLKQMILDLFDTGIDIETPVGSYRLLTIDDAIEIWLVMNDGLISDYEIHYHTDTRTLVRFDGWTDLNKSETRRLAYVWYCEGEDDEIFPTNLCIPDAGNLTEIENKSYMAQIAAFAQEVDLYKDVADYKANESALAPEAFIPSGTFSLEENDDDFEQTATAIMNAVIDNVDKKINSYSGKEYYLLHTHCYDFILDVLLAADEVTESPIVGGIISGTFYLSGHIYI